MTEIREGCVCQGKRIVKGREKFDKVAEKKNEKMKAEKRDDTHEEARKE